MRAGPSRASIAGMDNRKMDRAKPLILLVEDQSELREMYAQQLELSGFDVIQAGNGVDALTHTAAHAPESC